MRPVATTLTSRAIVVWAALSAVAIAIVTAFPLFGLSSIRSRAEVLGFSVASHASWWSLAIAAIAAALTISCRSWISERSWPLLQAVYGVLGAVWTWGLVRARHSEFTEIVDSAYLGSRFDSLLRDVPLPVAVSIVALLAGVAVVFVNACVQSLAGAVQARRYAPIAALSPVAAWYGDKAAVLCLVACAGVLTLSAMASERGRGLLWSTSLGLLSGLLLAVGALSGFAVLSAGVGMLCIFFLRRRSLMILVSGLGVGLGLLVASAVGWSWPREIGEASAAALDSYELQASAVVVIGLLVVALGGPPLIESGRKFRGTPAWPLLVTGVLVVLLGALTRSVDTALITAVAPSLPTLPVAVLGAASGIAGTVLCLIAG